MAQSVKPIAESYWVSAGRFLAGEYPGSTDAEAARARLERFRDAGVEVFIDVTEDGELAPYAELLDGAIHERHPIRDVSVPADPSIMIGILDSIDRHLQAGRTVYVHCWGGVGRTGTVVGCWLVRHGLDGQAALERLEALFADNAKATTRSSPETDEQRAYVKQWGRYDR